MVDKVFIKNSLAFGLSHALSNWKVWLKWGISYLVFSALGMLMFLAGILASGVLLCFHAGVPLGFKSAVKAFIAIPVSAKIVFILILCVAFLISSWPRIAAKLASIRAALDFCDRGTASFEVGVFKRIHVCSHLWVRTLIASFLFTIIVVIGSLFFIAPGIYFYNKFRFYDIAIADKGLGVIDAFRESSKLTHGHVWRIVTFCFYSAILMKGNSSEGESLVKMAMFARGAVGNTIMTIAAWPTMLIASAHLYRALQREIAE